MTPDLTLTPLPSPVLSKHAGERIRQRGLREQDIELIRTVGTPTTEGTLLLRRDVDRFERDAKKTIQRLRKLERRVVIEQSGVVVSAYTASPSKIRWLLDHPA